jgi:hypothetical protein
MLDNIFKTPDGSTATAPAPVAPVIPTPVVKSTVAKKVACTNCEDSGFTCSVCGYNKP